MLCCTNEHVNISFDFNVKLSKNQLVVQALLVSFECLYLPVIKLARMTILPEILCARSLLFILKSN